ncbi:serine hydrolase [Niveispirillum sp.]|uniref:serine hydrolase domain-containing protein n=1 Tax=Niveispirillum sp. TaxID=1917217 RepID=UPI001B7AC2FA|nr:serine hydrolase domain-containing protein [Niveispirillum sp.]MBP7337485.1 beta-lactamase family protein [Niveispirillum sp.]
MTVQARIEPAALDALLAPYDTTNAPGFAVGVALKGRPVYRRGVGMASIELPVTLSPTIRMRIGSTSKHFCVLAVMLLAEEGRLSIDDRVRRHLPELPAWADTMTVRQLMAHTSGMRDSLDLLLHTAGPGMTTPANFQFKMLAALDSVNFAPGASWSYNNGGYILLAEIVTRLGGRDFASFLRERIFEPVGMHDTMVRALDTDLVPNSATLHVPSPSGGYMRGVFGSPIGGEGGIVSTVNDMLLWLKHMSAPLVGSAATWAAMRTPHATHGYGLGLSMTPHRGLDTVHHAGAVVGGSSQMIKVLGHELDIIVMSNGRNSLELYKLIDDIIDRCLPGLPPVPEDVAAEPVAGDYYNRDTGRKLTLVANEGKQAIRLGGMTLPARRDAEGWLSLPIVPTDMRLRPVDDGGSLELTEFGQQEVLRRVTPGQGQDAAAILGDYVSAAAGISASIRDGDEAPHLTLRNAIGSFLYKLAPVAPDLWEARGAGPLPLAATLEIDGTGFLLTTGRTLRLRFERLK